jgi:hypothetical protein
MYDQWNLNIDHKTLLISGQLVEDGLIRGISDYVWRWISFLLSQLFTNGLIKVNLNILLNSAHY